MKKTYIQPNCEIEFYHLDKALADGVSIGGGMATSNPQTGDGEESWTKKDNSSSKSIWDSSDALGE